MAVDILHPLATLDWRECPGCELPPTAFPGNHVATLKDKIYIRVVDYHAGAYRYFIHSATCDLTSWTVHKPPEGLECFGLTSYHSQLLVVGGKERGKVTNKVWTSDNATNWQSSLPPMPNGRCFPLAVSTGPSPEYVIVAGGEREDRTHLTEVEVLLDHQWFTVPSVLTNPHYASFHKGVLYFSASTVDDKQDFIVYCRLQSLLAACTQSHDSISTSLQSTLWNSIKLPAGRKHPVYFGQRLTTNEYPDMRLHFFYPEYTAHHECPDENKVYRQWVYASDMPDSSSSVFVTTLPTEEMLVIAAGVVGSARRVYKGLLRRCQYSVDDQFSISALHKLEAAGIPVLSSLAPLYKELASALEISQADIAKKRSPLWLLKSLTHEMIDLNIVMKLWLSGKSPLLPTWSSLYETLKQLGLKELSRQIVAYLSGARSLKQLCLSVITSALLEHRRSLEPDQLHVRLPDYVPPRDKQLIVHNYRVAAPI